MTHQEFDSYLLKNKKFRKMTRKEISETDIRLDTIAEEDTVKTVTATNRVLNVNSGHRWRCYVVYTDEYLNDLADMKNLISRLKEPGDVHIAKKFFNSYVYK